MALVKGKLLTGDLLASLYDLAYCVDGMLQCEAEGNFGEENDWKHQVRLSKEKLDDEIEKTNLINQLLTS